MTRLEMLRAARNVVQVVFSEYLKIRSKGSTVLVFEGKQCPTFYIGKVTMLLGNLSVKQVIARNKRNVLELRELIKRNLATADDVVAYFVDRDYDILPKPGDFSDIYVTRGYSLENEYVKWSVVEGFLRANFDIADASDETALVTLKAIYDEAVDHYINASFDLQKLVYLCQKASIRCLPGEEISSYLRFDWTTFAVSTKYVTVDSLIELLSIDAKYRPTIVTQLRSVSEFESLEPIMEWRGKFHFSFLRMLLSHLAVARTKGTSPFSRSARIAVDPTHPSLLAILSSYIETPPCLQSFLKASPLAVQ
ncbi:MAG: DUF4435 domain-containing protein [Burkholderiaceae bacterium]|nr:DUF4435 domain-containing protein [Burkholderiaceae bacterium]